MATKILSAEQIEEIVRRTVHDEIAVVVRKVIREELGNVGLMLEGGDHVQEVRKDFMFVRSMRERLDRAASTIGYGVLTIIGSGFMLALWVGFKVLAKE